MAPRHYGHTNYFHFHILVTNAKEARTSWRFHSTARKLQRLYASTFLTMRCDDRKYRAARSRLAGRLQFAGDGNNVCATSIPARLYFTGLKQLDKHY